MILRASLFAVAALSAAAAPPASIRIDYPLPGTVFPPDFTVPSFLWRDSSPDAKAWLIHVKLAGRGGDLRLESDGPKLETGPIDPRAVSETNQPPRLTEEQAATRVWHPGAETWAEIKRRSVERPATVTITGYSDRPGGKAVSRGSVSIVTSKDPVAAPIFYRDVPLMPSELEKGVIKPLAPAAVPLIAWRLRDVSQPESRVMMQGLHTCANCHSFSRDGKTMGLDLDGPQNDKGLYAILPVQPSMTIRNEDVVQWSAFRNRHMPDLRVGFMSQVSPDGQHVVTMVDRPADQPAASPRRRAGRGHFYVANFKDYRFLQVFYPTRGILACYSRATGRLEPLPGADDPRYVHTNAVWSPDGRYLVFARAEAREPYPAGRPLAIEANDPNETPIQYDLYRIPFNGGKGGVAEPIAGASRNGMSNSFPKVSPDGRWIVFVQSRNGLLMRPDSQLYIVPFSGGPARKLLSNTPRMNSWHSFSPNGRWLVFSSKSRSPYTQMFLTHLDDAGCDTPPVLVENSTAANRAVNLPEFVNIPPAGMLKIDTPAVEAYRVFDRAFDLARRGQHEAAAAEWRKALLLSPEDSKVYMNLGVSQAASGNPSDAVQSFLKAIRIDGADPELRMNFGVALAGAGRLSEAILQYEQALDLDPDYPEAHNNLGLALARSGDLNKAIAHYRKALEINPRYAAIHNNLGAALAGSGHLAEAADHFRMFLEIDPESLDVHANLIRALAQSGAAATASGVFEGLLKLHPGSAALHNTLGVTLVWRKLGPEAIAHFERAIELNPRLTEARQNLGDAFYYLERKPRLALAQWRQALGISPSHLPVLNQIALVLATDPDASLRDGAEAVRLAERAVELSSSREPTVLDTLAAAYAEAGRFPEAAATARKAIALASAQGQHAIASAIAPKLTLYESGKPYRRPD